MIAGERQRGSLLFFWPKSVGCKIVDLRSRMRFLYSGYAVNARGNIDRFRATAVSNQGHVKRGDFLYRCLSL